MDNNAPMMHTALVYQIKKSRGINWTPSEKEYLMYLCCQRVGVIEDKKSDLVTLSKKAAAWKFIHSKFSARFGRKRTPIRIKEQWKRMKIAARAELRDRVVQPEVGVAPVDPNLVTNKYYGESLDIISKVQQILFCKDQPSLSISPDIEEGGDSNCFEIPFTIKTEPMDDTTEILSDYSDSHGSMTEIVGTIDSTTDESDGDALHIKKEGKSKKEFRCGECNFKSFWHASFIRHRRIHNNTMFNCDKCPSKFYTNPRLQEHLRDKHGDGILCSHCSKIFGSKEGLDIHLKLSIGDYKYKCDTCHKTFVNKSHYDGHVNKHRNYKPHKCPKCKKAYQYNCTLKKHMESCLNDKSYDCNLCAMKFPNKDGLKSHTKGKHSNTVHKCKVCGKCYNWSASYYRHMKSHK